MNSCKALCSGRCRWGVWENCRTKQKPLKGGDSNFVNFTVSLGGLSSQLGASGSGQDALFCPWQLLPRFRFTKSFSNLLIVQHKIRGNKSPFYFRIQSEVTLSLSISSMPFILACHSLVIGKKILNMQSSCSAQLCIYIRLHKNWQG